MFESLGSALVMVAVGAAAWYYWEQTGGADGVDLAGGSAGTRSFGGWLGKGVGLPLLVLGLLCTGWLPGLPPLLGPAVGVAPGSAAWVLGLPNRLSGAAVVMTSWWGAVTLAWLLARVWPGIEEREGVRGVVLTRLVGGVLLGLLVLGTGGLTVLGFAFMVPLAILLSGLLPLRDLAPKTPLYSRAVGHLKLGHYPEAEQSVLEELERCPDDYDGWMLLAELYAEHFGDLSLAEQTLNELCDQPSLKGIQISLALHRLADWQLKLGQDPEGARRALAGIEGRLAGSHFARMAGQRLRQLPVDREELQERRQARRIPLPSLKDPLDDALAPVGAGSGAVATAVARANRLVEKLQRDPGEVRAREELARLLVERLDRVQEGMEQIRQLLAWSDRPVERVPEWLALLAAWHLRQGSDKESARPYLEALVREHPDAPQALAARRRLTVMDLARATRGGYADRLQKHVAPTSEGL